MSKLMFGVLILAAGVATGLVLAQIVSGRLGVGLSAYAAVQGVLLSLYFIAPKRFLRPWSSFPQYLGQSVVIATVCAFGASL